MIGARSSPDGAARRFRAHARRFVRLHARVTHADSGWEHHGILENIGFGGACLLIAEPLLPGDALTLALTAPTLWDPLVLRGRTAWVAPAGAGWLGAAGRASVSISPAPGEGSWRAGVAFAQLLSAEGVFALFELLSALAGP
jgi:hypothetical protein